MPGAGTIYEFFVSSTRSLSEEVKRMSFGHCTSVISKVEQMISAYPCLISNIIFMGSITCAYRTACYGR